MGNLIKGMLSIILVGIVCAGCATGTVSRMYNLNANGFSKISDSNKEIAKKEAYDNALINLYGNLQRFMEYKVEFDKGIESKIEYESKIVNSGVSKGFYFYDLGYRLDLYEFVAKNADFQNYNSWELLGLENYYSDYMNSNRPIGIWIQEKSTKEKLKDPVLLATMSVIPCYSGNFMLGKNIMGGFFAVGKSLCLVSGIFNEQNNVQVYSYISLALLVAADIYAVITGSNAINKKLEYLEDAVLSKNTGITIPVYTKRY